MRNEREEKQKNNARNFMKSGMMKYYQKRGDSVQIRETPMSQPSKRMIQPLYL
jgi:hypothetical protein